MQQKMQMIELNFPKYTFRMKKENEKTFVFDRCRAKFVALTPEEWVRQNMVEFLITEKHYPASLIANETAVEINQMKKRCDTVIYNTDRQPSVIVEYKAPSVSITQKVFDQIATYNSVLQVPILIVSNGLQHYCCQIDYQQHKYLFFPEIPDYSQIQ